MEWKDETFYGGPFGYAGVIYRCSISSPDHKPWNCQLWVHQKECFSNSFRVLPEALKRIRLEVLGFYNRWFEERVKHEILV